MSDELDKSPLTRSFSITERALNEEARTVEIAFSSETPVERDFGAEVLDHNPQSVRLDRLNGGAAVLVDHDTSDHVGVVESARIDADGKGRAVIRFSRSARGQEIMQDVMDGIRQLVSVSYKIHKYAREARKGLSDLVRVTDWEPFELSIVAIPAELLQVVFDNRRYALACAVAVRVDSLYSQRGIDMVHCRLEINHGFPGPRIQSCGWQASCPASFFPPAYHLPAPASLLS